jgi:hypothetical protein
MGFRFVQFSLRLSLEGCLAIGMPLKQRAVIQQATTATLFLS